MPKVPKAKVIGIVGSRRRDTDRDRHLCLGALSCEVEFGCTIVSGGCPQGGDRFAEIFAKECNIPITIHYPNKADLDQELLKTNPRAAYAIINYARNTLIAEDCDVLIALVAPDRKGGTENCVATALKLGKRVVYV